MIGITRRQCPIKMRKLAVPSLDAKPTTVVVREPKSVQPRRNNPSFLEHFEDVLFIQIGRTAKRRLQIPDWFPVLSCTFIPMNFTPINPEIDHSGHGPVHALDQSAQ